jgi:hypothetical protein
MNEKNRLKMLGDLIDLLKNGNNPPNTPKYNQKRPSDDLNHLYVRFFDKKKKKIVEDIAVTDALDFLYSNTYHFENFDLTNAHSLELHTM